MNRRKWLKSGAMAMGGTALAASLPWGAYGNEVEPFWTYAPRMTTKKFPWMDYPLKAKLNANENKYGPSKMAMNAVMETANKGNFYAHKEVLNLIDLLAEKEGVRPEQIMIGPGSTDLLEKIAVISFMKGKGNVVSADPAYMSVVRSAQNVGAKWKNIPCRSDWSHDLEAMYDAIDGKTKLVYVCNPNNPTGSATNSKELWDFCVKASKKAPVFVDEAYLEFMDTDAKSMVGLIREGKDVILSRTFSKIHGMAGLRVGYIVATEERISSINSILRASYNPSVTSLHAAMASLTDEKFLKMSYEKNLEAKSFTIDALREMGMAPLPSQTSFLLFPLPIDGELYMKGMYEKGVGVRLFTIDEKSWGRVSMGTMDEMKLFASTLKQVVA
ncbi:MAG: histidinol-phosphate transaminase [Bacteroidota bacterium]